MAGRSWAARIGIAAVASAIAIWLVVAETIRRSTTLEPKDIESLVVIIVTGCLLDGVVLYGAIKRRVGWPAFVWLGLRAVLSVAGLLWITLPSYAIAIVAFGRDRRTPPRPVESAMSEPVEALPDDHA